MGLDEVFIDPHTLPEGVYGFIQLLFLLIVYAYILFTASNLISDGSELLLLVPAVAGIVGSVILPILGAVPDGAIVLFSGLGPDAQNQLSVGVGALAGSTIMLLTIPWFLSIVAGRVTIQNDHGKNLFFYTKKIKLDPKSSWGLFNTGVKAGGEVKTGALLMLITSISYLVIQLRAFQLEKSGSNSVALGERFYALVGLIICTVLFFGYLVYQWMTSEQSRIKGTEDRVKQKYMEMGLVGIVDSFRGEFENAVIRKRTLSTTGPVQYSAVESISFESLPTEIQTRFKQFVKKHFDKYDTDKSRALDIDEIKLVFKEMNEALSPEELKLLFKSFDTNNDNSISFDEFVAGTASFIFQKIEKGHEDHHAEDQEENQDLDDEHEDEEFQSMDPATRMRSIIFKSCYMMFLGTFMVLIFSDPMVNVLSAVGERTGVPAFYIAFVLAPLASNASELIASYNYAAKKTTTTIMVSLSALQGACCMNNTFCLGVFLALIYFRGLVWEFSAETTAILGVQLLMALICLFEKQTLFLALLVISLYPLSLLLVSYLESKGWD
jgi:Ca2+/Na+ antiporter